MIAGLIRRRPDAGGTADGLLAEDRFRMLLDGEKRRVDRNGRFFSIAIFESGDADKDPPEITTIAKAVKDRIRITDAAGWLKGQRIGVFLPDTPEKGAWKLTDDISAKFAPASIGRNVQVYPFRAPAEKQEPGRSDSGGVPAAAAKFPNNSRTAKERHRCISVKCRPPAAGTQKRAFRALKRTLDLTIALPVLAAACPLMLAIAAVIKLISAGPVMFMQERVGLTGDIFTMLKFRTMDVTADPAIHEQYVTGLVSNKKRMAKIDDRQQLIPMGQLLRRTFLDELPQLLNVIKGQMSIVGPRPAIPYELNAYSDWHMERFAALPGMTGLWQVSGKNRLNFDDMVRLDIRYTRSRSIWTDVKILLKTPLAIMGEIKNSPNTV